MAKKDITSGLGGVPAENLESAGIPDSPIFHRNFDQAPEVPNELLDLHVNGTLVRDLPIEMQRNMRRIWTDEGFAEANQGKEPRRVETIRDEFTGSCLQRKDDIIDRGMEPWEAANPMKELASQYVRPGFKAKFLSPARVDKDGMRGYQPILKPNGDPVKLRNMVLAEMPVERVKARNKFFSDKAAAAVGQVKQQFLDEGGKMSVSD